MGGAPAIETIRAGVQFTPEAAAAFRRLEAEWLRRVGRRVDVNSTYRDWDQQMAMYLAWEAWVAGRGPRPNHSRAIHPSLSRHTSGTALDSDDWNVPGFIALAAEYGFIRTAAGDPTEQHHFEYQRWNDRHYGEDIDMPLDANADYPAFANMLQRALRYDVRPNGVGADYKLGPTIWERLNGVESVAGQARDAAKAIKVELPAGMADQIADQIAKALEGRVVTRDDLKAALRSITLEVP